MGYLESKSKTPSKTPVHSIRPAQTLLNSWSQTTTILQLSLRLHLHLPPISLSRPPHHLPSIQHSHQPHLAHVAALKTCVLLPLSRHPALAPAPPEHQP